MRQAKIAWRDSDCRQRVLVRPEGLEPPAYWFEASRSIQLSYGRTTLIDSSRREDRYAKPVG